MTKSRKRAKNSISVGKAIITIVLAALLVINIAVICMGRTIGSSVLNNMPVAMIPVLSDSMNPSLKSGDAILTIRTDYEDIKIGDVVVYSRDGDLVVHEVIDMLDGYLITKGTANPAADKPVSKEEYRTKVWFKIPLLGGVWRISSKPLNFVLFVVLVTLLVFGDKIFSVVYNKVFENEDGEEQGSKN